MRLALDTNLKFYTSLSKEFKLKVRKVWGLIPTFIEVTGEKLVGGGLFARPLPPPILNRVKSKVVSPPQLYVHATIIKAINDTAYVNDSFLNNRKWIHLPMIMIQMITKEPPFRCFSFSTSFCVIYQTSRNIIWYTRTAQLLQKCNEWDVSNGYTLVYILGMTLRSLAWISNHRTVRKYISLLKKKIVKILKSLKAEKVNNITEIK